MEKKETKKAGAKKRGGAWDKKSIFSAALACAAVILAVVLTITFASSGEDIPVNPPIENELPSGALTPDDGQEEEGSVNVPVEEPAGMVMPMEAVAVTGDFGFYYNQTLDCYFHHDGVDFAAAVGAEVFAVEGGTVESVFVDDVLSGGEIVLDHGNGMKTTYRFVTPVEGLAVGVAVKKGDVIATVAEATGDEYKDGAHLHFEMAQNGASIDPATHLPLQEK